MGDPNGIETQSTSGFHVAPWAEEIKYLWEKYQRVNTSVIHNETITSATLSSTLNITIYYNITIPLKEGYNTSDYLPVRWKFWFVDTDTNSCVDQSREQRFIEPYCNPLIAQIIGLGNSTLEVNVTIRPSLKIGNYTIIRELEVDPQQVWISYGHGPIGSITVLEDNTRPLVNASVLEPSPETKEMLPSTTTTTTTPILEEGEGQCIQLLMPVTTTSLKEIEKRKTRIIGMTTKEKSSNKSLNLGWLLSYLTIMLLVVVVIFYFAYTYVKEIKKNKEERDVIKWYNQ
jgi:hypothetical protein